MPPDVRPLGRERSIHVVPRSSERKRWSTLTSIHTTPLPAAATSAEFGSGIGVGLAEAAGDAVAPPDVTVGVELGAAVAVAVGVGEASAALPHDTSVMLKRQTISFFTRTIMPASSSDAIRAVRANAYARRRT